ncbi:MAG: hypothetical protein Q9180_004934 [Flavoplaca navasiana]
MDGAELFNRHSSTMKQDKNPQTKIPTKPTRSNTVLGATGRPLGHSIAHFIESTERKQLVTNISHYINFAHEHLHTQQINFPSLPPETSQAKSSINIDWKMIVKSVAEEEKQLEWYNRKDKKTPNIPYFCEVGRAAAILKMQYNHVRDLVKGYAKRKPKCGTRQTDQLIKDGDFAALAKNLSQTMFQLGWFYSNDVETEAYVRGVLKRVHDYFFRNSWLDGWDGVCSYGLSEGMLCRYLGYRVPERVEPDKAWYRGWEWED